MQEAADHPEASQEVRARFIEALSSRVKGNGQPGSGLGDNYVPWVPPGSCRMCDVVIPSDEADDICSNCLGSTSMPEDGGA